MYGAKSIAIRFNGKPMYKRQVRCRLKKEIIEIMKPKMAIKETSCKEYMIGVGNVNSKRSLCSRV